MKTYLLALKIPNVTAGLDHVTSTGLPFEVPAENPGAKCRYCFWCAVPPLGNKPVTNLMHERFAEQGYAKRKGGYLPQFSVKSYWIRLKERVLVVSVLSSLISQNNLLRPLVKRRPHETDFGTKVKNPRQCFILWRNLWRNWYVHPIIVPHQLIDHLEVVRLATCRGAFLERPGKFSGPLCYFQLICI